jgi:hypothetical protein
MRAFAAATLLLVCWGCDGSPSSPTSATAPAGAAATRTGSVSTEAAKPKGDGFTMHVACEPKAKGDKRDHFEVTPVGGGAGIQVRCKGYVDLKQAGSFVVTPMSDTDQGFVCQPSPATVTAKKPSIKVTCTRG